MLYIWDVTHRVPRISLDAHSAAVKALAWCPFARNVLASGVVPQISLIMGPCAGGAVYSPAMTDFIFMVKDSSYMFVTGPDVVKTVTNEEVTFEDLGGAMTHGSKSGVTHFTASSDEDAIDLTRDLIGLLPSNNLSGVPNKSLGDSSERLCTPLDSIVPKDPNKPYDVNDVITEILDAEHS